MNLLPAAKDASQLHRYSVENFRRVEQETSDIHKYLNHGAGTGGAVKNPTFEQGFDWWEPSYNDELSLNSSGAGWAIQDALELGSTENYFAGHKYATLVLDGGAEPMTNAWLATATKDHSGGPSLEQIPFMRDVELNVTAWVGKRGSWVNGIETARVFVTHYDRNGNPIATQFGSWYTSDQIAGVSNTGNGNLTPIGAALRSVLVNSSFRDAVYSRVGVQVSPNAWSPATSRSIVVGQIHADYAATSENRSYHRVTLSSVQSYTASSWHKVSWDSISADGGWGSGVDLICPVGGLYAVSAFSHFNANATRGITAISVTSNASPSSGNSYSRIDSALEGGAPMQPVSALIRFTTGNPLNLFIWCNNGSAQLSTWSTLMIARIA